MLDFINKHFVQTSQRINDLYGLHLYLVQTQDESVSGAKTNIRVLTY